MPKLSVLSDPKLCVVFAYAPAGLGHLRVTDALRHGLPETTQPILLPESSESIRWIHRLTSRNPFGKRLMEWAQYGWAENVVTAVYRRTLQSDAHYLEEELIRILKQRVVLPDKLLVVATHFGLAHQLSSVKRRVEQRARVKVILAMQVTDDSPQHIWFVPDCDLITVPSARTKQELLRYGKAQSLAASKCVVLPYPLSPHLGENLLPAALKHRQSQYSVSGKTPINVCVPISGAGVGTPYVTALMKRLSSQNNRFLFHVIAKRAFYTDMFIESMKRRPYTDIASSHSDREIVELYEQLYDQVILSIEITKPSEQAFKALFTPKQTGGVILLFSAPVGRQEYDNLDFMRRHGLIPSLAEQGELFTLVRQNHGITVQQKNSWLEKARRWRGVCLPPDPHEAATFIAWCHRQSLFAAMGTFEKSVNLRDGEFSSEVSSEGVHLFWEEVEKLL